MPILALDIQIKLQGTLIARINNGAKAGIRELMDNNVLPAARSMSPKRTGANADSLSTMTRQRGNQIQAFIRSNSGHGGYDEKGTSKMAARPYMKPAFDQSLPGLDGILKARMEEFANIDTVVADGGIEGLKVAIQKIKAPRMSKASRANRDLSAQVKAADSYREPKIGPSLRGRRPPRVPRKKK